MDIEVNIECLNCGCVYRDGFKAMPHGKALKCPLCASTELQIKGEVLIEKEAVLDGFDRLFKPGFADSKFKL